MLFGEAILPKSLMTFEDWLNYPIDKYRNKRLAQ